MAKMQQALADTVRLELELGLTFLDVAANTKDPKHAWRSVRNAITALKTADRFMLQIQPNTIDVAAMRQQRKELVQRLRAITGLVWPSPAEGQGEDRELVYPSVPPA